MKTKSFSVMLFLLIALPLNAFSSDTNLTGIYIKTLPSATRVRFQLTQMTSPRIFLLSNPERIVLDFKRTHLSLSLKKRNLKNAHIKQIRDGYPSVDTLRLVIDMNSPASFKVISQNSKEVIIDIFFKKMPKRSELTIVKVPRRMTIVIDPGHGGKDPGALGLLGTKEKDVVLAIAKKLADLINKEPGMRAILTRSGDYYVSLHNRLKRARKGKADLFIAIHADSYFNTRANGASVYTLSQHGASSIAARWLARRDNYSELGSVDLSDLEDQSHLLRFVLIDLAQIQTSKDSLYWGNTMLGALRDVTTLHYDRVEYAPFLVLKSPDIPSLLVETGFLSNVKEEIRLRDAAYQHKMALALYQGIYSYHKKFAETDSKGSVTR